MAVNLKNLGGTADPPKPKPLVIQEVKPVQSIAQGKGELAGILATIRKETGDKSVLMGSEVPNVRRLPTGVFEFDLATGGGFPFNRYSIVYGPESSGKTNIVYKAIAQAQRLPPPCNKAVFVDLEGTFDAEWATKFGVDCDELVVAKPSYGEQAVDMVDALVRANDVAFLALDSLAVIVAAKELEGSTEKADVGTAALLVKRLSNKLAVALSEEQKRGHDLCIVLLNQTRFKIGVMFGDPETMPGGQTVKFNASLIVRLYGKNKIVKEISAGIPAFKETNAVIKKAKIGVVQQTFQYDMTMLEHDGLFVGETDSFNKVKGYLQASGHIQKAEKGGWMVMGQHFPTLAQAQDLYRAEDAFALKLQTQVVQNHKLDLVPAASMVDPADGQPE